MNKKFENFVQFKKDYLEKYDSLDEISVKNEIENTGGNALIEEQNIIGNIETVKGSFNYKKFKFVILIKTVIRGEKTKEIERIYSYIKN